MVIPLKLQGQLLDELHECHPGAHPKLRTFDLYQPVRVKNARGGKEKWIQGTVAP